MKNVFKLIGVITFIAVIGFSMIACGDGGSTNSSSSNDNNNNPGNSGTPTSIVGAATLNLSGQLYEGDVDDNFTKFNGNLTVNGYYLDWWSSHGIIPPVYYEIGGNGGVTNGRLTFTIGEPDHLENNIDIFLENFRYEWPNVHASTNVKYSELNLVTFISTTNNSWEIMSLNNCDSLFSVSNTSKSFTGYDAELRYVYVDNDVTITATGRSYDDTRTWPDGTSYKTTWEIKNLSLKLKKGWNAVYCKYESSGTFTGPSYDYFTSVTETSTVSYTLENHSLKWVRMNSGASGGSPPQTLKQPCSQVTGEKGD